MVHTSDTAAGHQTRLPSAKVLCIDDDPEISRALQLRLREQGVEVVRAYFGMHGYWLALTDAPDAIITDVGMPQGQGDYVLESLKANARTAHIPVIVLTGRRDDELNRRLTALGAAAVLHKPICFEELSAALRLHIELQGTELCRSG